MNTKSGIRVKESLTNFLLANKVVVIVIVLGIVMSIASPNFLTVRNLSNIFRQISMSAIIGLGFTVVVASGGLDLSVGTMLGLVGVVMAKVSLIDGVPIYLTLIIGVLFGGFLGYFNGFLSTVFKLDAFIVTLATQMIFKGATYLVCGNDSIGNLSDEVKFFGQGHIGVVPVPLIILIIVGVVIAVILYRTEFGRHAIATGGNAQAARVSGINVNRVRRGVFALMGVCAAIAAIIMNGRLGSAQQTAGQGMEMDAIAAVVLGGTSLAGGKGNIFGTILGCLVVGMINNGLNLAHVDTNWQIASKGILIILAILLDSQTDVLLKKVKMRKSRIDK